MRPCPGWPFSCAPSLPRICRVVAIPAPPSACCANAWTHTQPACAPRPPIPPLQSTQLVTHPVAVLQACHTRTACGGVRRGGSRLRLVVHFSGACHHTGHGKRSGLGRQVAGLPPAGSKHLGQSPSLPAHPIRCLMSHYQPLHVRWYACHTFTFNQAIVRASFRRYNNMSLPNRSEHAH